MFLGLPGDDVVAKEEEDAGGAFACINVTG
jgi:hypothetical protein